MIKHPIQPLYSKDSKILILGSFPSVKSREVCFFYGHPQNRFWKVISAVFGEKEPLSVDEKRDLILRNGAALWDVIGSCDITGSSDSSIRNVAPNDIRRIIENSRIERVFVNGKTALRYYNLYIRDSVGMNAVCLPSTSAANASRSLESLIDEWRGSIIG